MAISQAVIVHDKYVLMVKQKTKRGQTIWNFPGGNIEEGETPEEACCREVKEETGYTVKIDKLIHLKENKKWTYLCIITGGELGFDAQNPENEDILCVNWVPLSDNSYFDNVTTPILKLLDIG